MMVSVLKHLRGSKRLVFLVIFFVSISYIFISSDFFASTSPSYFPPTILDKKDALPGDEVTPTPVDTYDRERGKVTPAPVDDGAGEEQGGEQGEEQKGETVTQEEDNKESEEGENKDENKKEEEEKQSEEEKTEHLPEMTTSPKQVTTISWKSTGPAVKSVTGVPSAESFVNHFVPTEKLLEHIHSKCAENNFATKWASPDKMKSDETPRLLIPVPKYNILYSSNPKSGSTSFKKFILRLGGDNRDYDDMHGVHAHRKYAKLEPFHQENFPDMTIGDMIRDKLYTVGFVRNPVTRFISGFRNKVLRKENSGFSKHIKEELGGEDANEITKFVTFVGELTRGEVKDPHFNPQWNKMQICSFPYDMLGQTEATSQAIEEMQKATGTEGYEFPGSRTQMGKDKNSSLDDANWYFNHVSAEQMEKFYEFYKWDFELLGYTKLTDENFPFIDLDLER
eukprot:sb/3464608/